MLTLLSMEKKTMVECNLQRAFDELKYLHSQKLVNIGWLTRFVAIITCRSCTAVDEKVCRQYNLRKLIRHGRCMPS